MYSTQELAEDFRRLGVVPGDTVMLHASVRAVGEVAGGPDQIHLALKQALTEAGTLMMYASCPAYYDEVGRGHLSPEQEREILQKLPAFDPLVMRSQRDNGALVELLRTYPGSLVNHHVARFVVWGKSSAYLISEQPWDFAFGAGSALDRFLKLDGKLLLLGSDHDAVTFLHYAEHVADIPNKRIAHFRVPVQQEGAARVWKEMAEVDTSDQGAHANWPDRFFAYLVDGCMAASGNTGAKVGNAQSHLIPARGLLNFVLPWMKAVAADATAVDRLRAPALPQPPAAAPTSSRR